MLQFQIDIRPIKYSNCKLKMCFELQPQGTFGNTPRNFLRGPGFANADVSLVKNQRLIGDSRLQVRLGIKVLF